jgi:hypothetical protein
MWEGMRGNGFPRFFSVFVEQMTIGCIPDQNLTGFGTPFWYTSPKRVVGATSMAIGYKNISNCNYLCF